jgi:hypothetical protein
MSPTCSTDHEPDDPNRGGTPQATTEVRYIR